MPIKKHYYERRAVYHLAFKTVQDQPLLGSDDAKQVVLDTMLAYREKLGYRLLGYTIMDNHVHAVVATDADHTIADIVRHWKGYSCRLLQTLLRRKGSVWKARYADNAIRSSRELLDVLRYVHDNPVKARIVENARRYHWSSAREYAGDTEAVVDMGFGAG